MVIFVMTASTDDPLRLVVFYTFINVFMRLQTDKSIVIEGDIKQLKLGIRGRKVSVFKVVIGEDF